MKIYPIHVATEGLLNGEMGIATRGWIILEVAPTPPAPPIIIPPTFIPVDLLGEYDWLVELEAEYDWDP